MTCPPMVQNKARIKNRNSDTRYYVGKRRIMTFKRLHKTLLWCAVLMSIALLDSAKDFHTSGSQNVKLTYTIQSDSGKLLTTLFDNPGEDGAVFSREIYRSYTLGKTTVVPSASCTWFDVPSVFASDCQADECGGAYMGPYSHQCDYQCGGNTFDKYTSNPLWYGPRDGWQYDGGTDCGPCQMCREDGCTV